jgi:peptide/nickel transport system permease protein
MEEKPGQVQKPPETKTRKPQSNLIRIAKFLLLRLIALFVTVVIGVYIAVLIANMGGAVDDIRKAQIGEQIAIQMRGDRTFQEMTVQEKREYIRQLEEIEFRRLGMDLPFPLRSFIYLHQALTLNLGRAEQLTSDSGSSQVRLIILERLVPTLLLMMTSFLILFFTGLFFALFLSRRYGSFLDKLVIAMAPTSSAPAWFYGIFLILIFAAVFKILPFGGMVKGPPPAETLSYALSVLRHLILPVSAIVISGLFIITYNWRTYFLIYSSEDYVDMAKAKGLSSRMIERRYILRPTMPAIVTSFALSLITQWMGSITLEMVFRWPGIGSLIFEAIGQFDSPVIIGSVVIYAYLLAITVFVLDITYAILDPRVKIGAEEARR